MLKPASRVPALKSAAVPVFLAFCFTAAAAAEPPRSWDGLRSLQPGAPLLVTAKGPRTVKGAFSGWSADALTLQVKSADTRLAQDTVERVQLRKARRLRNAVIGGGIGAAIGAVLYYTIGTYLRNEGQPEAAQSLLVIGPAAAFAGIGAAIPSYPTLYRAPRR